MEGVSIFWTLSGFWSLVWKSVLDAALQLSHCLSDLPPGVKIGDSMNKYVETFVNFLDALFFGHLAQVKRVESPAVILSVVAVALIYFSNICSLDNLHSDLNGRSCSYAFIEITLVAVLWWIWAKPGVLLDVASIARLVGYRQAFFSISNLDKNGRFHIKDQSFYSFLLPTCHLIPYHHSIPPPNVQS